MIMSPVIGALDLQAIFGGFGIDWHLLIIQTLNFVLVAFVLYRFGIRNVISMMDVRREKIEAGIKYADKMQAELAAFERSRSEREEIARREAANIVQEAKKGAREILSTGRAEAQIVADNMLVNARQEIVREKERTLRDVKQEFGTLVADVAYQLLMKNMTDKQKSKYVALAEKMMVSSDDIS